MSEEQNGVSRRRALKILGAGFGAAGAMSIYQNPTYAQHEHMHGGMEAHQMAPTAPKFFTPAEMASIAAMSDIIIPADDHSGGAKDAGVPAFIDLMVGSSPAEVRALWREGLAAVDAESKKKNGKVFAEASASDQTALLTDLAKNEFDPKTPAEQLFRAAKSLTIDGYYTSEIGIHKDLQYKGNSYNKEFVGCTHPEHMS